SFRCASESRAFFLGRGAGAGLACGLPLVVARAGAFRAVEGSWRAVTGFLATGSGVSSGSRSSSTTASFAGIRVPIRVGSLGKGIKEWLLCIYGDGPGARLSSRLSRPVELRPHGRERAIRAIHAPEPLEDRIGRC